jgi:hypothetical protein
MNFNRRSLLLLAVVAVVIFLLMRRQKREFAGNKLKVLKYVRDNASDLDGFGVIAVLEEEGFEVKPPQMEKILELSEGKGKKKALADFILAM